MLSMQTKRSITPDVDPKQLLRVHVEQMPVEKQLEFVETALQLMAERPYTLNRISATTSELLS